jgi:FKBP-type peptidyl-prolyl cis-trans isomerase
MYQRISTAILFYLLALLPVAGLAADSFSTAGQGVRYQDMAAGTGQFAEIGDIATIHFESWLDDQGKQGRAIYATRAHRAPLSFVIGTSRVMPGWNEGVIGMQAGGRRLVKIPAGAAYGARGVPGVVPSNTGMIFVIELLSLEKRAP